MDWKLAFRSLRRSPGFTALAVLILTLGIGANTVIFSVVQGVILRPLPFRDPDRLVSVTRTWKSVKYGSESGPDFLDLRNNSTAFAGMAAYESDLENVVVNATGEFTGTAAVSQDFFRTFAIEPVRGRLFAVSDWTSQPAKVAVVSQGFWSRHFGAKPFTPGQVLKMENIDFEIIGLAPGSFHFPEESTVEVWVPLFENLADTDRSAHNYRVVGRLRPGVTVAGAQAQLSAIADRLARSYPGSNKDYGVYVAPLATYNTRSIRTSLFILLGAVALVLLIACANIANLLLVRGTGRIRELSIRAALGADAFHLTRQLLTESLVLALLGCVGGVGLAYFCLPVLLAVAPRNISRLEGVEINTPVLLFSLFSGVLATFLFGLLPAWQAGRIDPNTGLRVGGSRSSLGGSASRLRQIFVAAEMALCTVLLASAGLLLRSFSAMTSVDLGFHPEGTLVAQIAVPGSSQDAVNTFFRPLLARLQTTPGVRASALACGIPGNEGFCSNGGFIVSGQTTRDFTVSSPQADFSLVSPEYFNAFQIPLTSGRPFSVRDDAAAPPVAIVNESLAYRHFPHGEAISQKILCGYDSVSMKWMTIVGVVRNAYLDGPATSSAPAIFMPYSQHPHTNQYVFVKPVGNPLLFAAPLRDTIRKLNGAASMKFSTMEDHLAARISTPRFSSILLSIFAGLAMALAAIGLYGVVAFSVAQRTPEIGLRLALGANPSTIFRMVLTQALTLTGAGLLLGLAGAAATARILQSQLFGISPDDPLTYALAVLTLIATALLASYLPALSASRVEPLEALRQE
ncbi:MAG: ABC transporter permease [Acidobacteriaceae bacterium]|nr:ABC transporter permease [Acidobacteriaceae bacterium]